MLRMAIILQKRDLVKISELSYILEVSPKQVRRYRDELDMSGIYIDSKTGRYGGYRLIDKDIINTLLSKPDEEIMKTVDIISNNQDKSIRQMFDSLLSFYSNQGLSNIDIDSVHNDILNKIIFINKAIQNNEQVILNYSLQDKVIEYILEPYYLYKKYNTWYLSGYHNKKESDRTVRLDKIKDISTGTKFLYQQDIYQTIKSKIEEYSGVFIGKESYQVQITSYGVTKEQLQKVLECEIQKQMVLSSKLVLYKKQKEDF